MTNEMKQLLIDLGDANKEVDHWRDAYHNSTDRERALTKNIDQYESKIEELEKENKELKKLIGLIPKSDFSKAVDPDGYATAAVKILAALKLEIGEHVNEHALPALIQIMKNNITT